MVTEDRNMCRRVRLTVRLGRAVTETSRSIQLKQPAVIAIVKKLWCPDRKIIVTDLDSAPGESQVLEMTAIIDVR
jgi:hypothetical protein